MSDQCVDIMDCNWLVVEQVLKVLEGHTGCVRAVATSADGSILVSGGDDDTVRVWNTETGEVRIKIMWFLRLFSVR